MTGAEFIKLIGPSAGEVLKRHNLAVFSYAPEHDHHRPQGTGTLLRIADKIFLVTASHVVAAVQGADHLVVGNPVTGRLFPLAGELVRTDEAGADVAIFAIDDAHVPRVRELPALSLSQTWLEPALPEGWFLLSGFPREWHKRDPAKRTLLVNPYQIVVRPYAGDTAGLKGFDSDFHLLVTYGKNAQGNDPNGVAFPESVEGMSGACIWRFADAAPNAATWDAEKEMRVVGVQTSEYPGELDRRIVRGTKWRTVVEFLAAAYPDLRPAINLHLR